MCVFIYVACVVGNLNHSANRINPHTLNTFRRSWWDTNEKIHEELHNYWLSGKCCVPDVGSQPGQPAGIEPCTVAAWMSVVQLYCVHLPSWHSVANDTRSCAVCRSLPVRNPCRWSSSSGAPLPLRLFGCQGAVRSLPQWEGCASGSVPVWRVVQQSGSEWRTGSRSTRPEPSLLIDLTQV